MTKKLKLCNGKKSSLINAAAYLNVDEYKEIHLYHPTKKKPSSPSGSKTIDIKPDTLTLLEKELGNNLEWIGTGKNFLNRIQISQALRSTIYKLDIMKLKSFCKTKDKMTAYRMEKYFLPTPHLTEN